MSNITLTMPPELIRKAKVMAAQREMSVSGLVAQLLASAVGEESDEAALWRREEAAMDAGLLCTGRIAWTRDEVHAR